MGVSQLACVGVSQCGYGLGWVCLSVGVSQCGCVSCVGVSPARDLTDSVLICESSLLASQTDFANRDARAAFFARLEGGGEGGGGRIPFPGGPSEMFDPGMGPRGGAMMIPHGGGMPMMGMGRGGFPRHGPPIDYYYRGGAPFMDDGMYYGGRPPFHGRGGPVEMGRFRPPFEEGGYDDYDDELRAFTRKREIEREREKRREKRRGRGSSSKSNDSDSGASSPKRRKKLSKDKRDKSKERKKSSKKAKAKEKDASESDEEKTGSEGDKEAEMKEAARLQATQKSRDLREKLRKKAQGKQKDSKDVVSLNTLPTSSGSENEYVFPVTMKFIFT